MIDFTGYPKISRFSREAIITEKIDGTNACIHIGKDGEFLTGSRTRWITPEDDNHGFSKWAHENKDELLQLGIGTHYGEWWGNGINRGYGLNNGDKRFSLFNASRWVKFNGNPELKEKQEYCPDCCYVVPIMRRCNFDDINTNIKECLEILIEKGSIASPGYMKPEGIVIYHTAGNVGFKKTIDKDDSPKSGI